MSPVCLLAEGKRWKGTPWMDGLYGMGIQIGSDGDGDGYIYIYPTWYKHNNSGSGSNQSCLFSFVVFQSRSIQIVLILTWHAKNIAKYTYSGVFGILEIS